MPGALPFCELHLHIEGTFEPETIFALAAEQGRTLPYDGPAELAARYEFANLPSFLELYYENMGVLRSERDFEALAGAYFARAHRAGVAHVELFVDPQAHTARGVAERTVLAGLHRAIEAAGERFGISAGIIACVLRDRPVDEAERMLDAVLEAAAGTGAPLLGLGLDSAELGFPPHRFARVFERAADAGLHRVAHAGEEGPADYVREALDVLGAERIDHGIRVLDDPALVERLARERIPLTVCPLSNVRLRVVDRIEELPFRELLDAGLLVTVNSDDPAYFGGYLDDNLAALRSAFGLDEAELAGLARNSIEASFASAARKAELLARLR
ncbi:adenosine deaminase [Agromyces mediolanus]|uniref:adenosine deaminase n=1 Tax=Agromyces mediolanus TaxID=41986 RepID=UPI003833B242